MKKSQLHKLIKEELANLLRQEEDKRDNTNRRFEISLCIEEYIVDEDGEYVETDGIHECEILERSSDLDYINDLYDSYMESLRGHEYTGIYK